MYCVCTFIVLAPELYYHIILCSHIPFLSDRLQSKTFSFPTDISSYRHGKVHPSIVGLHSPCWTLLQSLYLDNGHLERELRNKTENQPHFILQMYADREYKMFMVNVQLLL